MFPGTPGANAAYPLNAAPGGGRLRGGQVRGSRLRGGQLHRVLNA